MKRNQEKERNDRLSFKTLDTQFKQEAIEGLNCSPLKVSISEENVGFDQTRHGGKGNNF
jgi:hypothetical protein